MKQSFLHQLCHKFWVIEMCLPKWHEWKRKKWHKLGCCEIRWNKKNKEKSFVCNTIREPYVLDLFGHAFCCYRARACVFVCMCVCISFHRKGFSWLNKTINVMPEIRPASCAEEITLCQVPSSPRHRQS